MENNYEDDSSVRDDTATLSSATGPVGIQEDVTPIELQEP